MASLVVPPVRTPALKKFNGFYETECLCSCSGFGRKYSETMPMAQCPPPACTWADCGIRLKQMREHGRFLSPYREMCPGYAVLCWFQQPIATEIPAHWGLVSLPLKSGHFPSHSFLLPAPLLVTRLPSWLHRGLLSGMVSCKFFSTLNK